jgi:hypothetical protein
MSTQRYIPFLPHHYNKIPTLVQCFAVRRGGTGGKAPKTVVIFGFCKAIQQTEDQWHIATRDSAKIRFARPSQRSRAKMISSLSSGCSLHSDHILVFTDSIARLSQNMNTTYTAPVMAQANYVSTIHTFSYV